MLQAAVCLTVASKAKYDTKSYPFDVKVGVSVEVVSKKKKSNTTITTTTKKCGKKIARKMRKMCGHLIKMKFTWQQQARPAK